MKFPWRTYETSMREVIGGLRDDADGDIDVSLAIRTFERVLTAKDNSDYTAIDLDRKYMVMWYEDLWGDVCYYADPRNWIWGLIAWLIGVKK